MAGGDLPRADEGKDGTSASGRRRADPARFGTRAASAPAEGAAEGSPAETPVGDPDRFEMASAMPP
ncbi:hypothetical protein, partial [Embleya scabrispora]|uniref:hypothetical protein n=1 Tax=Embleya scabrispora TaxID=159449 RepID=UPI001963F613